MPSVDCSWVDIAFPLPAQKKLNLSVRKAIAQDPKYIPLLTDIGTYITSIRDGAGAEPLTKKRKLDTPSASGAGTPAVSSPAPNAGSEDAVLRVDGISFSVPQRKKFNLAFTSAGVNAVTAAGSTEFGVAYDDIEYACCLPVPDKSARQWNFCVFPKGGDGVGENTKDALVFTIPDGEPKTASGDAMSAGLDTTSYRSLLVGLFNKYLKPSQARISAVEEPKESIFFSTVPQSHRKGEKAFHVKAHRGSKEGYLFFLERGILWAFKKPLVYFSFGNIDSVSYTSITKRTFNLSIRVQEDRGGADLEFSMIDQEDYPGIDAYIKSRKLNDASMAESRRAKTFNVNGKTDEADPAGMGELEKALYDAEDEEEEDYIPGENGGDGSDAESDDTGSESDSDSDENAEMESDGEHSVDLHDELGSEMEDVDTDAPKPKRGRRGA